jgi:hypothetical protein
MQGFKKLPTCKCNFICLAHYINHPFYLNALLLHTHAATTLIIKLTGDYWALSRYNSYKLFSLTLSIHLPLNVPEFCPWIPSKEGHVLPLYRILCRFETFCSGHVLHRAHATRQSWNNFVTGILKTKNYFMKF